MTFNRTPLVLSLVVLLLVLAAGAVLATTGNPTAPVAQAPAAATPTPTPTTKPDTRPMVKDNGLATILDGLVTKGTITAAQKTAILDAVAADRTAKLDARKAMREQAKADWKQVRDFLSDGVITKDEFAKLPATSPLRKLTTLMDDGQITQDELKDLGRGLFDGGKWNKVFRGHHGWSQPSPSPSSGTSG